MKDNLSMCGNVLILFRVSTVKQWIVRYKKYQTTSTQIHTLDRAFISRLADLINGDIIYKTLPRLMLLTKLDFSDFPSCEIEA